MQNKYLDNPNCTFNTKLTEQSEANKLRNVCKLLLTDEVSICKYQKITLKAAV